jgi:hypothetical protein
MDSAHAGALADDPHELLDPVQVHPAHTEQLAGAGGVADPQRGDRARSRFDRRSANRLFHRSSGIARGLRLSTFGL